jgi:hypothetical protein
MSLESNAREKSRDGCTNSYPSLDGFGGVIGLRSGLRAVLLDAPQILCRSRTSWSISGNVQQRYMTSRLLESKVARVVQIVGIPNLSVADDMMR